MNSDSVIEDKNLLERLKKINHSGLRDYLQGLEMPCYESELFKIAFPGSRISGTDSLSVYQNHFLLFHILYKLQKEYYKEGRYLHIHFMRTFLVKYPVEGLCRFYDEHSGRFCGDPCAAGKSYCSYHSKITGELELEEVTVVRDGLIQSYKLSWLPSSEDRFNDLVATNYADLKLIDAADRKFYTSGHISQPRLLVLESQNLFDWKFFDQGYITHAAR